MTSQAVRDNIAKLRKELPETVAAIEGGAIEGEFYRRTGSYPPIAFTPEQVAALITPIDGERLARAILAIGISTLDWHVTRIVAGEDDDAEMLAGLIATRYSELDD